jgi:hypothetical protein
MVVAVVVVLLVVVLMHEMQGLNGLVDINRHNTILEAALGKLTFQVLIIN